MSRASVVSSSCRSTRRSAAVRATLRDTVAGAPLASSGAPKGGPVRAAVGRWGAALTLGSALLLAGCFGESAQELLASAKTHLEKKDHKAAVIQLKNALQKDDRLAEARYLLARALLDGGDVAGAIIEADKAQAQGYDADTMAVLQARLLLAQGKTEELYLQYGARHLTKPAEELELQTLLVNAYLASNRLPEARGAIEAALKSQPGHLPSRLHLVRLLSAEGKPAEAASELDRLLAAHPSSAEAWQMKGDLQLAAGAPAEQAIGSFRKAIELDGKRVGAHAALVSLLLKGGDKDAAKQAAAAMKSAAPNSPETYYYAALMALESGQLKEASQLLQPLLKVAPNNPHALFLAGRVALANGDMRQAEAQFAKVAQTSRDSLQARIALAQVQLRGGDPEQAMSTLEPVLGEQNVPAEALTLAAEIRLRQGQGEQAESLLARAAEVNPNDVRSRVGLALVQVRKGQEAQGVAALRRLAAEDSGVSADLALVSVLLRKKDPEPVRAVIQALEQKQPRSPVAPELRGRLALSLGDRDGARREFEEALRRDPTAMSAANSLAALDVQDKRPEAAAKRYDVVLKADPRHQRAQMAQLGLRLSHGLITPDEASQRLTAMIKTNPEAVQPRIALVGILLDKQDLKQALSVAQEGIVANPENPGLLEALGQVQLAAGDRQQAASTFGKLSSLQPRSPVGPLRLADLHLRGNDRDGAAAALKRALGTMAPNPELAEKVTGRALQIGRADIALQSAKALQEAQPKQPMGWKLEGDVAVARKDWPAALAAFRKAEQLTTAPSSQLAIALHGTLLVSGRADEAARYANAWMDRQPRDLLFRYHLGDAALARGQFDKAEQQYAAVLVGSPDNAAALNNMAWLKMRSGKTDEALTLAEKATALRPRVAPYLDTLAEVLAAKGQTDKAITAQQEAVRQAPGVPAFRLRLAQLYVASGNKTEARAELKRLSDLGPGFEQQAEVQKLQASIR